MKTSHLKIATLAAALAVAALSHAQSAPFAPGPKHPMAQPLDISDPNGHINPALQNVPPMQPQGKNEPVVHNRVAEFDPISGSAKFSDVSSMVQNVDRSEGYKGSVNLFDREPNNLGTGGGTGAQSIIGADERTTINNASAYPWRANAKIYMTFPNGKQYVGSCTIVNGKYALTAGHCVYSAGDGGWARSIQVFPGLSGNWAPYGSAWVTYMRTYTGWTQNGNNQYDIALVTLDRNIGATTGWFGYGSFSDLGSATANLSAYDADINPTYQKYRFGAMYPQSLVVYYYLDTMPGSSGGGVYRMLNGGRYVCSVNNWQYGTINMSVRITSQRFSDIQGWIASGF